MLISRAFACDSSLARGVSSLGAERNGAPGDGIVCVCRSAHHGCNTEITMKPMKSAFACLAATGLLLAQPAAAASAVRASSPTGDSEELAGVPGAALPALIAILAVAIVAVVSASSDDDNVPASP
jgi:hypothetical protein